MLETFTEQLDRIENAIEHEAAVNAMRWGELFHRFHPENQVEMYESTDFEDDESEIVS